MQVSDNHQTDHRDQGQIMPFAAYESMKTLKLMNDA